MSYHNHLQIKSLPDQFEHTALDFRARSIRLVQLHRERSGHELLECTIRAASTDSHYVCLSYVWGEPGQGRAILLNGHRYWVRQNLWNFLHAARQNTEVRRRWIWIDALCIDQNNVAERQHQVQQMGLIYSNAAEVYTWLGNDDLISRFLAMGKGYDSVRYNRSSEPVLSIAGENVLALCSSPYWRRAWTTQEFALARQVTLMACGETLAIHELPTPLEGHQIRRTDVYSSFLGAVRALRRQKKEHQTNKWAITHQLRSFLNKFGKREWFMTHDFTTPAKGHLFHKTDTYADFLDMVTIMRPSTGAHRSDGGRIMNPAVGDGLLYLLNKFRRKECHTTRDRVFSLLAMCRGGTTLNVDYTISDVGLAHNILYCERQSFCLCAIRIVVAALEIPPDSWCRDDVELEPYHVQITLPIVEDQHANVPLLECGVKGCLGTSAVRCAKCQTRVPVNTIRCKTSYDGYDKGWMTITLELRRICSAFNGSLVIHIESDTVGFTYQYFATSDTASSRKWTPQHCDSDLDLQPSSNAGSYVFSLTLEFWVQLVAQMQHTSARRGEQAEGANCCHRVTAQRQAQIYAMASHHDRLPFQLVKRRQMWKDV